MERDDHAATGRGVWFNHADVVRNVYGAVVSWDHRTYD